jgi:hypothetical protein
VWVEVLEGDRGQVRPVHLRDTRPPVQADPLQVGIQVEHARTLSAAGASREWCPAKVAAAAPSLRLGGGMRRPVSAPVCRSGCRFVVKRSRSALWVVLRVIAALAIRWVAILSGRGLGWLGIVRVTVSPRETGVARAFLQARRRTLCIGSQTLRVDPSSRQ